MQMYLEFCPSFLALINIIVLVNIKNQITPDLVAISITVKFAFIGYDGFNLKLLKTDN